MDQPKNRSYIAIDLKSFYASVECVSRGLDPLTTNLVVADPTRTEKTICLAVSPSLKSYGIPGRARLFEAIQRIKEVNNTRKYNIPGYKFKGKSVSDIELKKHSDWEIDFITAPPRMAHYIQVSTEIYQVYLKYIAPEDIHVYSIDEVFIDATNYLQSYKMTAHELAMKLIGEVLKKTGITATAGIGTNLYLCKIAMDILAKHVPADQDGVRIAELDEMSYRQKLWNHQPLTSFWRVGRGIADKLKIYGIDTMGKLARLSLRNEDFLYKLFGVNAELLIDHAWGWEPCTMNYIKAYKPETNSMSSGQVLQYPYDFNKAKVVVMEMSESIALDLVSKHLVTEQLVLTIGYDIESLTNSKSNYKGEVKLDWYGRLIPKHTHGTANLEKATSSAKIITDAVMKLYDKIVDKNLLIRRINLTTNRVVNENTIKGSNPAVQLDLFTDYEVLKEKQEKEEKELKKERRIQETLIDIKRKYGKNSILKGLNFEEGATAKERNKQIGGHKA